MSSAGFKTAAATTEKIRHKQKTTTRTDRHIEFAAIRDRQVSLRELQADLTVVTGQPVSHCSLVDSCQRKVSMLDDLVKTAGYR